MGVTFLKIQSRKNVNINISQEISDQLETNEDSKKIDPYYCAIKTMVSGKLKTVGHIPREVSRHTYFYIKEKGRRIDHSVLSTRYRPSLIPSGGLKIPLMMTFRSPRYITHQKMKDFMTKLYSYDHKPVTKNVQSDLDSDEFHIEIKENDVEEGEDSKVVAAPEAKKRKMTVAYNSDDCDEEKEKTQKKTTFKKDSDDKIPESNKKDSDDAIPGSMSKLSKIVSYDDTDNDSWRFAVYAFLFVPILDLVCILYFLSINNYLQMLTSELDFASF